MLFGLIERSEWIGRRAACKAAIVAEADRLIAKFNDQAYFEAKDRVRGRCIDGTRSARYWTGVKREIAKRQRHHDRPIRGRYVGLTSRQSPIREISSLK